MAKGDGAEKGDVLMDFADEEGDGEDSGLPIPEEKPVVLTGPKLTVHNSEVLGWSTVEKLPPLDYALNARGIPREGGYSFLVLARDLALGERTKMGIIREYGDKIPPHRLMLRLISLEAIVDANKLPANVGRLCLKPADEWWTDAEDCGDRDGHSKHKFGSVMNVVASDEATSVKQREAWARYFVVLSRTLGTEIIGRLSKALEDGQGKLLPFDRYPTSQERIEFGRLRSDYYKTLIDHTPPHFRAIDLGGFKPPTFEESAEIFDSFHCNLPSANSDGEFKVGGVRVSGLPAFSSKEILLGRFNWGSNGRGEKTETISVAQPAPIGVRAKKINGREAVAPKATEISQVQTYVFQPSEPEIPKARIVAQNAQGIGMTPENIRSRFRLNGRDMKYLEERGLFGDSGRVELADVEAFGKYSGRGMLMSRFLNPSAETDFRRMAGIIEGEFGTLMPFIARLNKDSRIMWVHDFSRGGMEYLVQELDGLKGLRRVGAATKRFADQYLSVDEIAVLSYSLDEQDVQRTVEIANDKNLEIRGIERARGKRYRYGDLIAAARYLQDNSLMDAK